MLAGDGEVVRQEGDARTAKRGETDQRDLVERTARRIYVGHLVLSL